MTDLLSQLKTFTKVVADTGDIDSIEKLKPVDATTNPSLILKAAQLEKYRPYIEQSIMNAGSDIEDICDHVIVNFGARILDFIPGRVSSEVDARLSFDTKASVDKGRKLIKLYAQKGIPKTRVLIKLASTWEGIKAAEILEQEGIACNLTLIFSKVQAMACAEANVTLISPFVGRIYDWYKTKNNCEYSGLEDPGINSVKQIIDYYKSNGYKTSVMGASFRNLEQIRELAGCDLLTISPDLIDDLQNTYEHLDRKLSVTDEPVVNNATSPVTHSRFLWEMNEDPMATEKLSEGIRNFAQDQRKLEQLVIGIRANLF